LGTDSYRRPLLYRSGNHTRTHGKYIWSSTMRLDSLMSTVFTNTLATINTAWNVVMGQGTGGRCGSNTYHYPGYQPSQRPRYAGVQPANHRIVQHRGRTPGAQPSVLKQPHTVNYIKYVFNTNYVRVGDVKSAQVGVHVNSGNGSMNNGNFGNYGNNGNSGSDSRYANHGSNGNLRNSASARFNQHRLAHGIQA